MITENGESLLGNIRVSRGVLLIQENLKGEKCVHVDLHHFVSA